VFGFQVLIPQRNDSYFLPLSISVPFGITSLPPQLRNNQYYSITKLKVTTPPAVEKSMIRSANWRETGSGNTSACANATVASSYHSLCKSLLTKPVG
jgi:hypothetical protein